MVIRALPRIAILATGCWLLTLPGDGWRMVVGVILVAAVVTSDWQRWWGRLQFGGDYTAPPSAEYSQSGDCVITLEAVGENRIENLTAIRAVTGVNYRTAVRTLESVPAVLLSGVDRESAALVVKRLQRAGATGSISTHA